MRRFLLGLMGASCLLLAGDRYVWAGGYGGGVASSAGVSSFGVVAPSATTVKPAIETGSDGDPLSLSAGDSSNTNGTGGALTLKSGAGTGLGNSGTVNIDVGVGGSPDGILIGGQALYVKLSAPAATKNGGTQNVSSRVVEARKSVAPVDCAAGALNATVTQLLDGSIFTCGSAQTLTLPTWQGSSGIVQNLPGFSPAIGDIIRFTVASTAAANFTLAGGTGGTVIGNAITNNTSRVWTCRLTSVGSGTETASCY